MTMYGLKAAEIYEWLIFAAKLTPMQISVIVVILAERASKIIVTGITKLPFLLRMFGSTYSLIK